MIELAHKCRSLAVGGLLFVTFAFSSCDFNYETSYIRDNQIKVTKNHNGLLRELTANQPVSIHEGVISGYDEGLVMELTEEREGMKASASLKEEEGVLDFQVQQDELIREFYDSEEDWLQDFLLGIGNVKGGAGSPAALPTAPEEEDPRGNELLSSLKDPGLSAKEQQQVLERLLSQALDPEAKLPIAEYILNDIKTEAEKPELLKRFIREQQLSRAVKVYIADHIRQIPFPEEREEILALLVKH